MLDASRHDRIQLERRGNGVVAATLNRPERLNAVVGRMPAELANIARDADNDYTIRVLLLTGAGRAFFAGGDFSADSGVVGGGRRSLEETPQIVNLSLGCSIPVISVVKGRALGLAAARWRQSCQLILDDRRAHGSEECSGCGPGEFRGSGRRCTRQGPRGRRPAGDGTGPAEAIAASKAGISQYSKMVSNQVLPYRFALDMETFQTEDAREAAAAFQEERPPRFTRR